METKFRGKRVDNDFWVKGYYRFDGVSKYEIMWLFKPSQNQRSWKWLIDEVSGKSVGQATGLEDKKKDMIYAGDICKSNNNTISFVVWCLDGWRMNSFYDGYFNLYSCIDKVGVEIIGNLTDNPELIKG